MGTYDPGSGCVYNRAKFVLRPLAKEGVAAGQIKVQSSLWKELNKNTSLLFLFKAPPLTWQARHNKP